MPNLASWHRLRLLLTGVLLVALLTTLVLVLVGMFWPRDLASDGPLGVPGLPQAPPDAEVLLAVGDTGSCDGTADDAVADLASELPGEIALLGDLAYPNGTAREFDDCLGGAWGSLKDRLRPTPGNHEYRASGAEPYFDWFGADAVGGAGAGDAAGADAGSPGRGWYSYDIGAWHVVVLNSNCPPIDCDAFGPQGQWLAADLAQHAATTAGPAAGPAAGPDSCLLAYWHHPRYSSGRHGSNASVAELWAMLVDAGADIVLNGHDHSYERIAVDGVREFVVGTGGRSLYSFDDPPLPTTETRHAGSHGLLWLALSDGSYEWDFLPLGDTTYTDSGQGDCDGVS